MPRLATLVFAFALGSLAGCGQSPGGLESFIRNDRTMSSFRLTTFNLAKQPDGAITGTAATEEGDTYEIQLAPGKELKDFEIAPTPELAKKIIKKNVEPNSGGLFTSMELSRIEFARYTGTAQLLNGGKIGVTLSIGGRMISTGSTGPVK